MDDDLVRLLNRYYNPEIYQEIVFFLKEKKSNSINGKILDFNMARFALHVMRNNKFLFVNANFSKKEKLALLYTEMTQTYPLYGSYSNDN
ncbi:hypothetical protein [Flagellimonas onchidii]|uniref:hypothetical protein n=1 Tax=Flagellimonas onchidii TaxID=2562684 RepID=UPI0010A5DC83|nr:hypothetical protein [Allomuricauda onchidii]